MATISVAEFSGACFGVERALRLAHEASAAKPSPVRTLGPIIHNPRVVDDLAREGVVSVGDPEVMDHGTLIIRAHGVPPKTMERARAAGLDVVDATCPFVLRAQRAAASLAEDGYQVIVVGEPDHPEVAGILGAAGEGAVAVTGPGELTGLELARKVGVVAQTTQTEAALAAVVSALCPRVSELMVHNTICTATSQRQESARELASRSDLMIVIGGRSSGNTRRLFEICSAACPNSHHIEAASEIDPAWVEGCSAIGVTAGASTPSSHIDEVTARLEELVGA